ncbi:MAG TPA: DUF2497 domain-containing protein [Beijerinckiaceae bacterium]|jgi:hypothetical protein
MEEILASIRRIIADDQEAPKAPAPKPAAVPPPPQAAVAAPAPAAAPAPEPVEEDVLELAEVAQPVKLSRPLLAEEPPEIDFREVEEEALDEAVEEFSPRPPEPAPASFVPPSRPEPMRPDMGEQLLSDTSHAAVGQAFNMLAHTVLSSNTRTLEDLVREMLRPMLKNWLDDNLPTMVERLVRAEIERVARGGR